MPKPIAVLVLDKTGHTASRQAPAHNDATAMAASDGTAGGFWLSSRSTQTDPTTSSASVEMLSQG